MYAEIALVVTWVLVIPYLIMFPPHRFWRLRAKVRAMQNRRYINQLAVKPKWIDKKTNMVSVPAKSSTVIALINPKSGGQLGELLLKRLRSILSPVQVVDLTEETPDRVFQRFHGKNVKLLVCGGDGTVGWTMNEAEKANCRWPIAILPLGTGNDLSRSIGWGGGATPSTIEKEYLSNTLRRLCKAPTLNLDRWTVRVRDLGTSNVKTFTMNNYVSIGVDAEIGLKFHNERKEHPERFSSQQKNVLKYAMYGFEGSFEGYPLGDTVSAVMGDDDEVLEINPHWKGLVVNNLPVYHGGKDFWGSDQDGDNLAPVDMTDGKLEVMGLSGTFHIGLVHISLDQALRLAQPTRVTLRSESSTCIQIDGEPFDNPPCIIEVEKASSYPVLNGSAENYVYDGQDGPEDPSGYYSE